MGTGPGGGLVLVDPTERITVMSEPQDGTPAGSFPAAGEAVIDEAIARRGSGPDAAERKTRNLAAREPDDPDDPGGATRAARDPAAGDPAAGDPAAGDSDGRPV
jgi:hypothetical protein